MFGAALVILSGTAGIAAERPTVASCGSGTHAVVRHVVVNGRRIRRVTCARNTAVQHRVAGTTATTVHCGAGTHAVVHHPTVNGRRIRQVVCVP
jgi:hypothetical protein